MEIKYKPDHQDCLHNNPGAPRIILGGDFVFDEELLSQLADRGYDQKIILDKKIRSILGADDPFYFNFEGVISDKGEARLKALPRYFSFRSPPEIIPFMRSLSNPIMSLANNHVMDFGREALEDMLRLLSAQNIHYVGAGENESQARHMLTFTHKALKIGLLAYTDLLPSDDYATNIGPGAAKLTLENLRDDLGGARKIADFVIVSLHTIKKLNSPFSLLPDTQQTLFSRKAIEYGADVVFGHQPHGLQRQELFRGKPIFYSLGAVVYNPRLGEYFRPGHEFHESTQVYGGGIAVIRFCQHGFFSADIIPTRAVVGPEGMISVVVGHDAKNARPECRVF